MILAFKDGRKFATSWAAREIYKALNYANYEKREKTYFKEYGH